MITPGITTNDKMDVLQRNTVACGYLPQNDPVGTQVADSAYVAPRQFGVSVPFSCETSALGDHIGMVVRRRSEEQMLWVATWRVVAPMEDEHSIGDRADRVDVGRTMGADSVVVNLGVAVAIVASWPEPLPATITNGDLRPEVPFAALGSLEAVWPSHCQGLPLHLEGWTLSMPITP